MDVHGKRVTTEILTSNIIPIFSLPVVDDLPSELGNSGMFSATDWISGFFQCAINKDSIPLTAYPRGTTKRGRNHLPRRKITSEGVDPDTEKVKAIE